MFIFFVGIISNSMLVIFETSLLVSEQKENSESHSIFSYGSERRKLTECLFIIGQL